MTQETASYFVTWNVSFLDSLRKQFEGRVIGFGLTKASGTEFVHVTVAVRDQVAESALLGEIYQASSAMRRNAKQASKGV